jgi:heme-degrading monooxygenase HmoA
VRADRLGYQDHGVTQGDPMHHVRLATYTLIDGTAAEVADKAKAGLLPLFRGEPGFVRYRVLKVDPGTIMSVSEWENDEEAHAASQKAATWVATNLGRNVTIMGNDYGDESLLDQVKGEPLFDESA